MKDLLAFLCLFLFAQAAYSQCLTDGITFTTQGSIDSFSINYPGCVVVKGDVRIGNIANLSTDIQNLDGLSQITSIGGYLSIFNNKSLKSINGLSHVSSISNSFNISNNKSLTNVDGLSQITSVSGVVSISENEALVNVDGLSQITSINGYLLIELNNALTNIDGLSQITSIETLWIWGNGALINIDGLNQVTSINGEINIYYNAALTNIDGISNINPTSLKFLSIYNNPNLSQCAVQSVCEYLALAESKTNIQDNKEGCNSDIEVLEQCGNVVLGGHIFYDFNQNGKQDSLEAGLSGQTIHFTPGQSHTTDPSGFFVQACDSGVVYNLEWLSVPDWILTTDSTSYTLSFTPENPENLNKDFGLFPTYTEHSGVINLSSGQTRCNTSVPFFLRFQNTGTFIESGYAKLKYDQSVGFVSAEPVPTTIDTVNHILTWTYYSIYPYAFHDVQIDFLMPDQNSTGTPIIFLSEIYRDSEGVDVLMDSYQYDPIVLCSFDPNDKLVTPAGVQDENYTLHDQKLTYTVRFQNTGNAAAIDVTILDTIDTNLDISQLRIINSSFPVQTTIDGQNVEFYFHNIWLPDSTSNERDSHGFVTYEIMPMAGLADYTTINNTAHIVFDSNDAIVTNTATNTMVTQIPVGIHNLQKQIISIRPNPASDKIQVIEQEGEAIRNILIYNNLGQLMLAQKSKAVDVSNFPKGLYVVKAEMIDGVAFGRLIVE